MEVQGKIKVVGKTKEFGNNGFRKREIVITTDEQYPQDIMIEFVQDKCDLLDSFQIGQEAKIGINLRGREWTSPQGEVKYFNSIQGWRIDAIKQGNSKAAPTPPVENFEPVENLKENEPDDLPF